MKIEKKPLYISIDFEDIYNDYSSSVVYVGNRKNNKIYGVGSGFVINHKGKL